MYVCNITDKRVDGSSFIKFTFSENSQNWSDITFTSLSSIRCNHSISLFTVSENSILRQAAFLLYLYGQIITIFRCSICDRLTNESSSTGHYHSSSPPISKCLLVEQWRAVITDKFFFLFMIFTIVRLVTASWFPQSTNLCT